MRGVGNYLLQAKDPSSRLAGPMSARLFTCVCGFEPPSLASQKKHRRICFEWRDRSDPRGLLIARCVATRRESLGKPRRCSLCRHDDGQHDSSCPDFFSPHHLQSLERADIDVSTFGFFLTALRKRYRDRGWVVGGTLIRDDKKI